MNKKYPNPEIVNIHSNHILPFAITPLQNVHFLVSPLYMVFILDLKKAYEDELHQDIIYGYK